MTEAEWLACAYPEPMLRFLRGKISDRKVRLFAAACCRHVWPSLTDQRSWQAVLTAEQYADGLATADALDGARADAEAAYHAAYEAFPAEDPRVRILEETEQSAWDAAVAAPLAAVQCAQPIRGVSYAVDLSWSCVAAAAWAALAADPGAWDRAVRSEYAGQAVLLRCVSGSPFRPAASELAWRTPALRDSAQAVYDERSLPEGTLDNTHLAALADALEGAGCTDAYIPTHCRGAGPHIRGCWVVDLLLGKT
jgi:hypothetical protein